jgi:hypothetical protein
MPKGATMRIKIRAMRQGVLMGTLAAMMLVMAGIALAADINGKWKADFDGPDGSKATNTFTFKVDGEKVTGNVHSSISGTDAKIEEGTLKGDDLSFSITRNFGGADSKFFYKGKVKGDEIALSVAGDVGGQSFTIEMTAKREKP